MLAKKTQRAVAILMALSLCFGTMGTAAMAAEGTHEHSDACGYVAAVEGQPCTHEHDETCGYVEAKEEVPCDMKCTDTDGDGVVDHVEDCAYQPAEEGQPCTHVHNDACGYVEAVEGQPCAVETVETLIAALPGTVTSEDADAIDAARAAYNALDESLKADVSNYAVLTAAEEALAALEEGGEEPAVPEIPEETCTVDYTKRQSESVTYDGYTGNSTDGYVFNYTIHEGAPESVVIDLAQCALDLWEHDSQVPGDHYKFQIMVKNESGNVYQYKDGSFVLAPGDSDEFGSLEEGSLLPVLTYDGQYLPIKFSGAMIPEYFYQDIFHVGGSGNVTFEMMCQIYSYLAEAGYTGETAITDYLLDYFNELRGVSYDNLTDLFADHPDWLDGSKLTSNGIWTMTEDELLAYIEQYPWIDRFVSAQSSGSNLSVQIKWPEPEIAAVSYNSFYMGLFSVVYGKDNVDILNPNGAGVDFSRAHAVGDYMSGTELYTETNSYFTELTKDGFQDGETLEIWSGYGIDGPGMGNSYQNYSFTYYNIIELEQIDSDVTVNKVDESGNALDGAQFKLYKLDGENKLYYTEDEGVVSWQADETAAKVFEGGSFNVNLLFGTYYLTEVSAPSGYDGLSADLEIVVDETAETVNVTNTRQYIPGPSYNYYTVTVNYYDKNSGEKIASSYVTPSRIEGSRYDVTEYDAIAIDGYTYDSTSGDALTGILNSNKVVNVYYVVDDTDIPDDDTPTGDQPELPDEGGETDIPDDDTPTGDQPDLPDEGGEEVDIGDGETPTGDLPQTGTVADNTMNTIGMLLLALSMATAGAASILWMKKSRR
ncbi:SpaA isopeptide-forming pilin-related protein [uncultured Pseudoflavonifractor sp.]|uniref:SpaA isopeptide-forming pilin-related protein n=1 Tax=uncultured Pseudoflavonifractor sp. TaxID=1221379 RepID=UPI0025F5530F|nr:SpaA isopeptide-forming pilin-related protein [uncultured Pseudoflavonifractor sp.]